MYTFFSFLAILVASSFITIFLELLAIRLPDTNKFKQWWRKHIIAQFDDTTDY